MRRQQTFDRKRDADAFDREIRRRQQLDGIVQLERGRITLAELMEDYWALHAVPNLAPSTRTLYAHVWDRHLRPRIGGSRCGRSRRRSWRDSGPISSATVSDKPRFARRSQCCRAR